MTTTVLLDMSGSMHMCREEMALFASLVGDAPNTAVVRTDYESETHVRVLSDYNEAFDGIEDEDFFGGTPLHQALETIDAMDDDRVIIVTDGKPEDPDRFRAQLESMAADVVMFQLMPNERLRPVEGATVIPFGPEWE